MKSIERQNSSPMTAKDHPLTFEIAAFRERIRAVNGNSQR
jgi:hypothetical protein